MLELDDLIIGSKLWMVEEYQINDTKVLLPVNVMETLIPTTKLETFQDTKKFIVDVENQEQLLLFINKLILTYMTSNSNLSTGAMVSLEDLTSYYGFVDLYLNPDLAFTSSVKFSLKNLIRAKIDPLYSIYTFLFLGDESLDVEFFNSMLREIHLGHIIGYYIPGSGSIPRTPILVDPYDGDCRLNHAMSIVIKDAISTQHYFANKLSDRVVEILDSMKVYPEGFIYALKGEVESLVEEKIIQFLPKTPIGFKPPNSTFLNN